MAKKKNEEPIVKVTEPTVETVDVEDTLTAIVNVEKLNVRKIASKESDVVGVLSKNDSITVRPNIVNNFYELANGDGFVMSNFVIIK